MEKVSLGIRSVLFTGNILIHIDRHQFKTLSIISYYRFHHFVDDVFQTELKIQKEIGAYVLLRVKRNSG